MKRFYLLIVLLFSLAFYGQAQVNLVVNPSFEDLIGCPTNSGQIDSAIGWSAPINGGGGVSELYHVCCTYQPRCGVPSQTDFSTSQNPHTGNGYAGIQTGFSGILNDRGYIQSKLSRKLISGTVYCITFFISLSDQSYAYIKPFGAYFDDGSISTPGPWGLAAVSPQVYNTSILLNDKVNWMKIEGSFTAHGNEQYITLGNFFPDSLSEIVLIGTPSVWGSYYYIDDVSVIETSMPAIAGMDTLIHPGDSVFIGRQPEVGLDEDCVWFVDGVPIDTIAGKWVKPDSTTTYILEQTICGNVKYDTVTVAVSGVGVEEYRWGRRWVKVYPNPTKDEFYVEYSGDLNGQEIIVELYTIYGALVKEVQVTNKSRLTVSTRDVSSGIYFYRVELDNITIGKDKIVIIK